MSAAISRSSAPAPRALSAAELDAIKDAARYAGRKVSPEDRWDLRQELAIKLSSRDPPEFLGAALRSWASHLVADLGRGRDTEKQALRDAHDNRAGVPYFRGPDWHPRWYPPAEGAGPSDPFACKGARLMHVPPPPGPGSKYEDDFLEGLDENKLFERIRKSRAAKRGRSPRLNK